MNKTGPRILLVDNYDSFTYNLVQILREQDVCTFDVLKNDAVTTGQTEIYDGFLFSPGPGIPAEAPLMAELLKQYKSEKSFLGICLGHQAIAETFGMKLTNLNSVRHGLKTVIRIIDDTDYIFEGVPSEFTAGLYHSWAVSPERNDPHHDSELRVTAVSTDGVIMALSHTSYDIRGIQFHPESFMSEYGEKIIHNWINHLPLRNIPPLET